MSLLESRIREDHYLAGETLIDLEAIIKATQVHPKLWSVMIRDEIIYEVEIKYVALDKQISTCECSIFKQENSCAHIAAALIYLRKVNTSKEVASEEKSKIARSKPAFTINTILNNIDVSQLKKYVKSYAQKDKNFGVLLKATFANAITLADNKSKYDTILNAVVKPVSTPKLMSAKADIRIALKATEEFLAQSEDFLSMGEYTLAIDIIEATLPKLHYIYAKYNITTASIVDQIQRFHKMIDLLYKDSLAPKLTRRLDHFIVELVSTSTYNFLDHVDDLFFISLHHKRSQVKSAILHHLDAVSINDENALMIGAIFIATKQYHKVGTNVDSQIASLKYVLDRSLFTEAIGYMEYYLTSNSRNRKVERLLLDTYVRAGQKTKFKSLAIESYIQYEDLRIYRLMKEVLTTQEWKKMIPVIKKQFNTSDSAPSLEARFYYNEDLADNLIKTLDKNINLRFLMEYDFYLYKTHYTQLETIYKRAILQYLDSHAGGIAAAFIDELFTHLNHIKAFKLVTALKNYIQLKYPHRSVNLDLYR